MLSEDTFAGITLKFKSNDMHIGDGGYGHEGANPDEINFQLSDQEESNGDHEESPKTTVEVNVENCAGDLKKAEVKPDIHCDAQGKEAKTFEVKLKGKVLKGATSTLLIIVLFALLIGSCLAIPGKDLPREKQEGDSDSSRGESILDG
uniref:CUB domain-containing protein n=1 Tax=Meloidogyne hapla TaxID=6305 RepID=A0A1I8AX97_MELHA